MKRNISNTPGRFAVVQWLVVACGMTASPAFAQTAFHGTDACKELVYQGEALQAQSKGTEALAKFNEAAKQCPNVSSPLSGIANLYLDASGKTGAQNVKQYRQAAEKYARAALQIEPKDPVALETLRALASPRTGPEHQPTPEALHALSEAEKLFTARKFDEAYSAYMEAQKLDPQWASPWVYAGDCMFEQKKLSEAEALYRKGTQVDPYFVQGWRFLAHSLVLQGKIEETRQALVSAINAQPDYMPAWENLSDLLARSGKPMTALRYKPKASVTVDKSTGKPNINLDSDLADEDEKKSLDMTIWMAYAMGKLIGDGKSEPEEEQSAFRLEYRAWDTALAVADEAAAKDATAKDGPKLTDPQLILLSDFRKNKQLDAALLLLTYREAYRADFEAWKKQQPDGVATFIQNFNVRP